MKITRDTLIEKMTTVGLPDYMHDGLAEYILTGRGGGNFLTAVLENDLREACQRADENNKRKIYEYVLFLYNYAPADCWGSSAENVARWRAHRGMEFKESNDV